MDLRILEIASNTENNKVLDKHTHKSKNKNPICGDEMEISLFIENNKVNILIFQKDKLFFKDDNKECFT